MAILGSRKTNYPYAVARVQAKRGKLIPRAEYDKILKMDVSEITRFIEESEYKAEVDELSSRFSGLDLLEAALVVNEERTYAEVRRMLQGEGGQMAASFLDRYFVEDVKSVLRGKNAGVGREELLKELLLEDLDTFHVFQPLLADDVQSVEDAIDALERQGGGPGAPWAKALRKVPSGSPLPAYEDALDKAYYARLVEAVEDFRGKGSDALREFARREIDARNLQNAARWVVGGHGGDFTPYVIPGGKAYAVADILTLSKARGLEAFAEAAKDLGLSDELQAALHKARDSGRLAPFHSAVWRAHMQQLDRLSHGHPLSILPILVYLVHKRREVVTLRAVARGRAAGLSEARLAELVA
jgi:V/A-type H+-transporting ATPase subunit C